ncbi:MAG: NADH-quinone oxidoreductase subunit N, partial [Acidobacteria bacterium]|nr:NADH-quinone oxidoreductase subunit N [Acidobacteriota bacterium]
AGFVGKYYLFLAAIGAGYAWLAVIAVLMSAVSMFYYLRLVVAMYQSDEGAGKLASSPSLSLVAGACLVLTLLLGILPGPMIDEVTRSLHSIVATLR